MSIKQYKIKPYNDIFTVYKIPFSDIEKANISLKDKNDTYSVEKHAKEQDWDIGINCALFSNGRKGQDPYYYWNLTDMVIDGKLNRGGNYSDMGIAFGNPWEGISAYQSTTSNSIGKKVDFVAGTPPLIVGGQKTMDMKGLTTTFSKQLTQRTAIGIDKANIFILVTKVNRANLTQVQEELYLHGCTTAINEDGGSSTAIYTKDGDNYKAGSVGRNVPSAFGIKLKKVTPKKTKNRWVQDAGHGGNDPGASKFGNVEKFYNLDAALYVNERLREHGIDSDLTRTDDSSLSVEARVDKIKTYTHCLSHHFNAGGGTGAETIHSIYSDGSFEESLIDIFRGSGYAVRPKPVYSKTLPNGKDYYYMHRETGKCKTTILEYEFLDGINSEIIKDKGYRDGMSECVVKAICQFEGVTYIPPKIESKPTDDSILYKVQVGAFANKDNATALQTKLKNEGYSAIIVETLR